MTIAAVYCPGPSLPLTISRRHDSYHAGTWAVNRALLVVPEADWLSAGDDILYSKLLGKVRPRIGAVTMLGTASAYRDHPEWPGLEWVTWDDLAWYGEHQHRRHVNWSVQIALLHAAERAHHIDLYGADGAASTTTIDCTGYAGEDRSPERWQREEADLSTTIALLAEHGVTVNRIQP